MLKAQKAVLVAYQLKSYCMGIKHSSCQTAITRVPSNRIFLWYVDGPFTVNMEHHTVPVCICPSMVDIANLILFFLPLNQLRVVQFPAQMSHGFVVQKTTV